MNLISKLKFLRKRQPLIIVTGNKREKAREAIFKILKHHFKIGTEILLFETKKEEVKKFEFFLKKSQKAVLVVTGIKDTSQERIKKDFSFIKNLPENISLVLNFDDEAIGKIDIPLLLKKFTFGFKEGADFRISDIKSNSDTNFKINNQGRVIPVWLKGIVSREQIYVAVCVVAVGTIFDLNLVEVSQLLKSD